MRVVVSGGGTGGHIYPALAIAKGLEAAEPATRVLYVGTKEGLEAQIVPREGYTLAQVRAAGVVGRPSLKGLQALAVTAAGVRDAGRILDEFQPRVVVGSGGFVCVPVILAAARRGLPTLLHEQNALPGLSNRLLSRFATLVCTSFPETAAQMPHARQLRLTGLPVRAQILAASREEARQQLGLAEGQVVILASGGSRGARSLNRAMVEVHRHLAGQSRWRVIHLTGEPDYQETLVALAAAGIDAAAAGNVTLKAYSHEMHQLLAAADLVIGRAGASFLAEVTARGLPSILIPYPYAAGNHQEHNAKALVARGAAVVIKDSLLSGQLLWQNIATLTARPEVMAEMAMAARALARPRALADLVTAVLELAAASPPGRNH